MYKTMDAPITDSIHDSLGPPHLLTDLLDPILTHAIRHWWHTQHAQLASPANPLPTIPFPPVHLLHVVPCALAPSAVLTTLAPYATQPAQWIVPDLDRAPNPDSASANGRVWMLDAFLKLCHLGRRLPSPRTVTITGSQADESDGESSLPILPRSSSPLMHSKCPLQYTHRALNSASATNRVPVLNWWLQLHRKHPDVYPLKYTELALDTASWRGYVSVLDWWLNSGLELRYSWAALADASEAGHVDVLEWWLAAEHAGKLTRDVSARVLDRASMENHVRVLDWWVTKGGVVTLQGRYSNQVIGIATARGHVQVLKWWKARVDEEKVPEWIWDGVDVVIKAARLGRIQVLEWLFEAGLLTAKVKEDVRKQVAAPNGEGWKSWKEEAQKWWVANCGIACSEPPGQPT